MEVFFHKNISALSGKCENRTRVFMHFRLKNNCFVRRYVYPSEKSQQIAIASNGPFISLLWWSCSVFYRNDLQEYAEEFRHQSPNNTASSYSIFVKIIWAISKNADTQIQDMNMQFIFQFAPSLKDQIEKLSLFKTYNYINYNNEIIGEP